MALSRVVDAMFWRLCESMLSPATAGLRQREQGTHAPGCTVRTGRRRTCDSLHNRGWKNLATMDSALYSEKALKPVRSRDCDMVFDHSERSKKCRSGGCTWREVTC